MSLCGFRVGWTFFIALIPVVGDLADAALGYNLVTKQAKKADIPRTLLTRMQLNTILATGIAMIPLAGDIIMAAFKPNSRNAILFEEFLVERAKQRAAGNVTEDAQAQQVIDRARRGSWSLRTGKNNALSAGEHRDGLPTSPQTPDTASTSTSTATQPQSAGGQPLAVKVAPPVPPRP